MIKRLVTLRYHPTDHADEQKRIKVSLQMKVSAPQVWAPIRFTSNFGIKVTLRSTWQGERQHKHTLSLTSELLLCSEWRCLSRDQHTDTYSTRRRDPTKPWRPAVIWLDTRPWGNAGQPQPITAAQTVVWRWSIRSEEQKLAEKVEYRHRQDIKSYFLFSSSHHQFELKSDVCASVRTPSVCCRLQRNQSAVVLQQPFGVFADTSSDLSGNALKGDSGATFAPRSSEADLVSPPLTGGESLLFSGTIKPEKPTSHNPWSVSDGSSDCTNLPNQLHQLLYMGQLKLNYWQFSRTNNSQSCVHCEVSATLPELLSG